jgi:beta-lactamase superfamily II metal-dependent hydrolase
MKRKSRLILVVALLALALAVVYYLNRLGPKPAPEPRPIPSELVVRFLDVGQGDAQLLQLPGGERILIDAGDRGAPTDELLDRYGVEELDLVIATHPHSDHIGDMREVMGRFEVKEFWDSGFPHSTKTYTDMLEEIRLRGIKFATPRRGDLRKFGEVLVEVLHPAPVLPDDEPNNASLVVRIEYRNTRLLFTGDAEKKSWQQMISSDRTKLRAELLKAAHHGSSDGTTPAVLEAVSPSVFVVSCAAGNDYHHPHSRVMTLLRRRTDIEVYRTDLQGTITAVSDGRGFG